MRYFSNILVAEEIMGDVGFSLLQGSGKIFILMHMLTKDELEQLGQVVEERVKKHLKPVIRKLNRLQKDVSWISKTYDEGRVNNRRRIERIEEHVHVPQPE